MEASLQIPWLGFLVATVILGTIAAIRIRTLNKAKGVTGDGYSKGETQN